MKRHQHIAFLAVFIAILLLILFSNKFRDFSNSIPGIVVMGIFSYFSLCVVVGFLKIASREEAVNTQAEEIIRKEKEASEQPKNNINHS